MDDNLTASIAQTMEASHDVIAYLPELLGVCDTIAVMHRGILGPKHPVSEWDEYAIMNEATSGVESTV